MMDRLPLIVKRLVAISLLALSVALFWLTAIAPLEAQFAVNRAAIEDTRLKYQRYRSVADYASQLDDFAKQLDTDRFKGLILGGDSDAVALAGLQSTMQTLAVSNNAQVLSAQALPRFIDGDVRMVGVRVDLAGDLTAVQSTLHEIESNNPLLFITRAILRRREGAPENAAYEPVVLDAQLDIYGARPLDSATGQGQ